MNQKTQAQGAPAKLVIASRESALAMWQAEHIRDRLRALYPQTTVSILGMTTQGDQILNVTLASSPPFFKGVSSQRQVKRHRSINA